MQRSHRNSDAPCTELIWKLSILAPVNCQFIIAKITHKPKRFMHWVNMETQHTRQVKLLTTKTKSNQSTWKTTPPVSRPLQSHRNKTKAIILIFMNQAWYKQFSTLVTLPALAHTHKSPLHEPIQYESSKPLAIQKTLMQSTPPNYTITCTELIWKPSVPVHIDLQIIITKITHQPECSMHWVNMETKNTRPCRVLITKIATNTNTSQVKAYTPERKNFTVWTVTIHVCRSDQTKLAPRSH